tara:strand:- start:4949 stop:5593 length:645 start_codon:yes stop_codon:yes gene_type:complete
MRQRLFILFLLACVTLLTINLFGNNAEFRNFKKQIAKFEKNELAYKEEINDKGKRVITQELILLSQSDAIEQGLLEIDELKKVNSQVSVITNTLIDTIFVTHIDTAIAEVGGEVYLKLPQQYRHFNEHFSFNASINLEGLFIERISIENESVITIGYKKQGLFKPMLPVVQISNSNPYIQTHNVSNVVIQKDYNMFQDKRAWGLVGLFVGVLIK